MSDNTEAVEVRQNAPINLQHAVEAATKLGQDGVAVLKELQAIHNQQAEIMARQDFNKAVAELHARIGSIPKNRTANFKTKSGANVSYKYADLHQIASSLRNAGCGELGLSWSWDTEYAEGYEIVTCMLCHSSGHCRKSTWRAPIEQGNPMASAPQKAKIATTFAQRVTLIQVFGLTDTDDDVDGQMPNGGESITDEQALQLEARTHEAAEATGRNYERLKATLFKSVGAESFESFPAAKLEWAMTGLGEQIKKAEEAR